MRSFATITSHLAIPLGLAIAGLGCMAGPTDAAADPGEDAALPGAAERTMEIAQAHTSAPSFPGGDGHQGHQGGYPPFPSGHEGHGPGHGASPYHGDHGFGHGILPYRGNEYGHQYPPYGESGVGNGYPRPYWGGGDGDQGYGHGCDPGYYPPPLYNPSPVSYPTQGCAPRPAYYPPQSCP